MSSDTAPFSAFRQSLKVGKSLFVFLILRRFFRRGLIRRSILRRSFCRSGLSLLLLDQNNNHNNDCDNQHRKSDTADNQVALQRAGIFRGNQSVRELAETGGQPVNNVTAPLFLEEALPALETTSPVAPSPV